MFDVAPTVGAWIETANPACHRIHEPSRAPCGRVDRNATRKSTPTSSCCRAPCGRVDRNTVSGFKEAFGNFVAPPVGAWIETGHPRTRWCEPGSRPLWARGSKLVALEIGNEIAGRAPCGRVDRNKVALHERSAYKASRPLWARGSKRREARCRVHHGQVAPPAGAWIETVTTAMSAFRPSSRAPCGRVDRNDLSDDGF